METPEGLQSLREYLHHSEDSEILKAAELLEEMGNALLIASEISPPRELHDGTRLMEKIHKALLHYREWKRPS